MWKWLAGGAAVLLIGGGVAALAVSGRDTGLPDPPPAVAASAEPMLPAPSASPADREARRLARLDRNDDGTVSRPEYMASRYKAFDRLDTDHDGALSFAEYAVRTEAKFTKADGDHDGRLDPTELATTAPKPRPVKRLTCLPEQAEG